MIVELFCAGLLSAILATATPTPEDTKVLKCWYVDPLIKVFRDDVPGAVSPAVAHVARGEHGDFQVAVRSAEDLSNCSVTVSPFYPDGEGEPILPRTPRFVGFVHVDRPTQRPSSQQLRKPPADYPDILLEEAPEAIAANTTHPIWISVPVPIHATPGTYRSTVSFRAERGAISEKISLPLELRVYPVTVRRARLHVTNWFAMHWPHMDISPEPDSEAYYALLRRYARNMAEHRQNVALISPLNLAEFSIGENGRMAVDFSRFDRWVQIFREEGVIGRITGGHFGGRAGGWESDFVVSIRRVENGAIVGASVAPDSAEADAFYAFFLPALVQHLKERGWLDLYVQHLADEPIALNIQSYRAIAALLRKYAPELKIIEATHSKDLVDAIDVWVPQLNYLHRDFAHYRERQQAGEEVWFYTCVFPQGEYANRFIEQPLIKTRLLHWINFKYGITGYLHWGYNQWTADDPVTHTTRPHGGPPYLPAGDPWIVYPGRDGPLDSIRFEAMRDGIADHELLSMLAEHDLEKAHALAGRCVIDFDRYDTDVGRFRQVRIEILQALAALGLES